MARNRDGTLEKAEKRRRVQGKAVWKRRDYARRPSSVSVYERLPSNRPYKKLAADCALSDLWLHAHAEKPDFAVSSE